MVAIQAIFDITRIFHNTIADGLLQSLQVLMQEPLVFDEHSGGSAGTLRSKASRKLLRLANSTTSSAGFDQRNTSLGLQTFWRSLSGVAWRVAGKATYELNTFTTPAHVYELFPFRPTGTPGTLIQSTQSRLRINDTLVVSPCRLSH